MGYYNLALNKEQRGAYEYADAELRHAGAMFW